MKKALLMGLALLMLAGGIFVFSVAMRYKNQPRVGVETVLEPIKPIPGADAPILERYTLTKRDGNEFPSEELDGKVHVASFFFASCPATCLRQNQQIKALQDDFGGEDIKLLSITCDPKNDTPEVLAAYAEKLDASKDKWHFLTGDMIYLRRIGAEIYRLPVDEKTHADALVLVDKWGNLRGHFNWKDPARMGAIRGEIRNLLKETEPPPEPEPATATAAPPESDEDEDETGRVGESAKPSASTEELASPPLVSEKVVNENSLEET